MLLSALSFKLRFLGNTYCHLYPNRYVALVKAVRFLGDSLERLREFPRDARQDTGSSLGSGSFNDGNIIKDNDSILSSKALKSFGIKLESLEILPECVSYFEGQNTFFNRSIIYIYVSINAQGREGVRLSIILQTPR